MSMKKELLAAATLLVMTTTAAMADTVKGVVKDKATGEPLIGATVMAGDKGVTTDMDGRFTLAGLKRGKHTLLTLIPQHFDLTLFISS